MFKQLSVCWNVYAVKSLLERLSISAFVGTFMQLSVCWNVFAVKRLLERLSI